MQGNLTKLSESVDPDGISQNNSFFKQTWGSLTKAMLGSFTAMVFGGAILMVSILAAANPASVYPHTGEAEIGSAQDEIAPVEYYLPYPGVLPDSPLYKLKAARDKVVLWVTFDELKKAEKELLYADKRINAAIFLADGGKEALGVSTATKAEKYLQSSVERAVKLSSEGKDVRSLLTTLVTSSAKHMELLGSLKERATGDRVQALERSWEETKVVHEKAEQALVESN